MKKHLLIFRKRSGRMCLWRPIGVGLFLLCLSPAVYGGILDKKVTVSVKKVTLQEAIAAILQQTDYGISYNVDEISHIHDVSLSVENAPFEEVLSKCLAPYGFTFSFHGQTVVISAVGMPEREVKGIVVDAGGEPLAGVSIVIRQKGHEDVYGITDVDGRFKLKLPDGGRAKIVFRFIGFKEKIVEADGKPMHVVLREDTQKLNEIVKIGYYDQRRGNLTGSVTSVMMDDILEPNMTTIDQALEGRIPDLLFMQNSGEVGATARLRVRGTSTLIGNREPLWVLDGFVLQDPVDVSAEQLNDPDYINYVGNAIAGINPQDIERIDVLKDASATALYGTRASNGVIVVTTKKGRPGPPSISYANNTKFTVRPRYSDRNINLMNSQERMSFGKDLCDLHYVFPSGMPMVGYEGAYYRYQTGQTTYDEFLAECAHYETTNTDWFKLLTQDAWTQQHTLSISGGSESTRYYASIGYTSETGTIKTEFVDRYTASMNVMTNITRNLMANIRLNGNIQEKNHLPSDVAVLDYAYNTTRALPAYNEDGSLYYYKNHGYSSVGDGSKHYSQYDYNIINEMNNTSDDYSGNTFMVSADLTYKVKDIVDLTAAASYSRSSTLQTTWYGEKTNYVAILKNGESDELPIPGETGLCELPYGGVYNTTNTINESFTGRLQANLHWSFGDDKQHLITSTAGYEVNMARSNGISDQTRGYYKDRGMKYVTMDSESLDDFPLYKEWLAAGHRSLTAGKTNQLSGYLTAAYSYYNLFTVSLSGRFDASNKFGSRSNEKFLPVWSVSGRWNIKDTFFPVSDKLGELSMRLSYGKTGNMLDGETPNLLINQGTMDAFYGENTSTVASLPNPNLRWEQTDQYNIGLDLNLFDGRLLFSTDFWYKYTTDAFASVNVALVNGVSSYRMNNGDIKNKGFSFSISGYPIRNKDWKLYLSTNYSYASNTVQTNTSETYNIENYLNGTAIVDGRPIGTFYSYKYLGLNPNTGVPMFDDYQDRQHLLAGKTLAEVVPQVMVESGNRDPDFTGSLYATLTWKQFSLNTNFNYRIGSKMRLFALYEPVIRGVSSDKNVRKEFVNRWQKPGDEKYTDIPVLVSPSDPSYADYNQHWSSGVSASQSGVPTFAYSLWNMYDDSDLRVVPGDYLRLSSLTLSYNFTSMQLASTFLKSLRLSFNVTNVFTLASSKLDGQDPTQTSFTGVNLSTRPSYTFGLNVSF